MLGVLEQPWTLTAAAAVVVVQHQPALVVGVIAFVVFAVVSTTSVGSIYAYYATRPVRRGPALGACGSGWCERGRRSSRA